MKECIDVLNELEIGNNIDVFQWKNPYYYPDKFSIYTGKVILVDKSTRRLVIQYRVWYIFRRTKAFVVDNITIVNPKIIVVKNYNRK